MSLSLYSAFVPTTLQILGSMNGILDKATEHCNSTDLTEADVTQAKLWEDMFPFNVQINQVYAHSLRAIESLEEGVFSPYMVPSPETFADLKAVISEAVNGLEAVSEDKVNSYVGKPMLFKMGDFEIPFIAENFLLSFSQPNFFFHAVTSYDILRNQGIGVGKLDYLGTLRSGQ